MSVEKQAPANAIEPGGIAVRSAKVPSPQPGADKGFLRQIVGIISPRNPGQKGAQPRLVPQHQQLESGTVPPGGALTKRQIFIAALIAAQRPSPPRPPPATGGGE